MTFALAGAEARAAEAFLQLEASGWKGRAGSALASSDANRRFAVEVMQEAHRRGRLLLAGDSCLQTPPFLGQGMCAGMRDAANLAWRLAAVLREAADGGLLDTYETERSPHVMAFIDLAVKL